MDDPQLRLVHKQIADLADHPGWGVVEHLCREAQSNLQTMMTPPRIPDHVVMVSFQGQISGMKQVLQVPHTVSEVFNRRDRKHQLAVEATAGRL